MALFQKVPKETLLKYRYPEPALKERYKILNWILIGIVGIFIIFRILLYRTIFIELITGGLTDSTSVLQTTVGMFFLINTAMLILMIWIVKLLFSFDARAYLLLFALSTLSIPNVIRTLDILSIVLLIASLSLSLFLKKKLFPNIPFWGYIPKQ